MGYSVHIKEDWAGGWISAPDSLLASAETLSLIPGTAWIWPQFMARVHLRKTFTLDSLSAATADFLCDNRFELYLNGMLVADNVREFHGDVTRFLREGENRINIRAGQTDSFAYFTSALCGKIAVGDTVVSTDRTWESYLSNTFWTNTEPENWMTGSFQQVLTLWCPLHPRAYKHSAYFRRSFTVPRNVMEAKLFVSAAGEADWYLDGARVDDEIFSQGVMDSYKEYHVVDLTGKITPGEHVLGAITGSGWLNSFSHSEMFMNKPMLLVQLELTLTDGTKLTVTGDREWKCALSPLTENDLQYGERYDARKEIPDWCAVSLDDAAWASVAMLEQRTERRPMVERSYPPVTVARRIKPITETWENGVLQLDFGENCAGRYELCLKGLEKGQILDISMGERLTDDGLLQLGPYEEVYFNEDTLPGGRSIGAVRNHDRYTAKGAEKEIYAPRFAFTGFRFLRIEGLRDRAQAEDVTFLIIHNALPLTGTIHSDYHFARTLYKAALRSWESNIVNGPMDCPTREKNYWTGDIQVFCTTACYLEDTSQLLARWTEAGRKMCPHVYGWGDEIYILPWTLYRFYRDTDLLKACYPHILAYVHNRCDGMLGALPKNPHSPFNDHLAPRRVSVEPEFFADAYFCHMLKTVAQIAEVLGDYQTADDLAKKIEPAVHEFNERFFLPEENDYTSHSQAALAMALAFDLVPVWRQKLLAEKLNERVKAMGKIDTGYIGTRFLMNILCDYGYTDTAFMLLDHEEYPSWKFMLAGGENITEGWEGHGNTNQHCSSSMNHFGLGSVVGWMFEYLGGIRWRESTPGFAHVVLRPCFVPAMHAFAAKFQSVNGVIDTKWTVENGVAVYEFETAVNGTLILPDGTVQSFEPGKHRVTTSV